MAKKCKKCGRKVAEDGVDYCSQCLKKAQVNILSQWLKINQKGATDQD